ncbi:MAG: bifunctional 4-hydroxy-2-oxoglutarate aldolase/2-dehydro-3-deoxy-phosphogluconate aldolase [Acidobacteriia bacterium]|nr:bifunctional 4-hydroxy-2-oxoglutarate aldolase/2-dehydro-3-deoxy-phosphogluconate aldolase [Terriglobia bacterium]
MKKHAVRGWIEETGIIAAVRVSSEEDALFAAQAVAEGGIVVIEIPLTLPQATKVISHLVKNHPRMVVGAGGVTHAAGALHCLEAGAQFLTCDGLHPAVIEFAVSQSVVVVPGTLTPTEVITAWGANADFVKVVPCAQIGGENYIGSLHRMFPHIPLIASGGVNQQNASNFILAGAVALGVGRELIPPDAIHRRQQDRIGELARRFLGFVKAGRDHLAARAARRTAIDED